MRGDTSLTNSLLFVYFVPQANAMKPTQPLELGYVRHVFGLQVAEMTGCLQQAEQANSVLLAQIAAEQTLDNPDAAVSVSSQSVQSNSRQHLRTNVATELVDSSNSAEQQSSEHVSKGLSASLNSSGSNQRLAAFVSERSQSGDDKGFCTDRQASCSVSCLTSIQETLQGLAETLAQDVVRLQKVAEAQAEPERQGGSRPFNWGFPESEVGASPGPSRPVTAAPYDRSHRPNRQWSGNSARHESHKQDDSHQPSHGYDRPSTAGNDHRNLQDGNVPLYDAAARRPGGRRRKGHVDSSWQDPVPPSRMPEEILRQAREDYMVEKNRVREKRLQELAAKDNSNAAVTQRCDT